jgi:hypothetical protein
MGTFAATIGAELNGATAGLGYLEAGLDWPHNFPPEI